MKTEELTQIREEVAASVRSEADQWQVNFAKLLGIADALMGKGEKKRAGNVVMARKLCSYYMRNAGYTFKQIAHATGVSNHATAIHHYNDAVAFIDGKMLSDKDYLKAHKLAKENGIW